MKLHKIKNSSLVGELIVFAEIVDGVLAIREVTPDLTEETGRTISVNGTIYDISSESMVDIAEAIGGKADHTAIAIHRESNATQEVFSVTVSGRRTMLEYAQSSKRVVAHIHIPFSGGAVSDCVVTIPEAIAGTTIVGQGLELQVAEFASFEAAVDGIQPKLSLGAIVRSDDLLTATVSLLHPDGTPDSRSATAFIEPTCGVALTGRVELVNGVGQAVVSVAGVPAGTLGRIKAGFRYYPGKSEISFQA